MDSDARKRPGLVWVITIFYVVSAVFTAFSFYAVFFMHLPVQPAQRAYFDNLTTIDFAITGAIMLFNVGGALALFLLRRIAPLLFSAAFALTLLQFAWQIATKNFLAAMTGPSLVGSAIGAALSIAIIVYAFRLRGRGVLA